MPRIGRAAQLMEPEDVKSFEMLPGEGEKRFHSFVHYRDLPQGKRSVARAWEDHVTKCLGAAPDVLGHKLCPNRWREWGTAWNWRQRALDWDREVDRRLRERLASEQVEAKTRHKRLAEMSLAALSVPGRVALQALQNPEVMQRLVQDAEATTAGFMKILDMVTWATKNMPGMVDVERLSLGMATEHMEIGPKPEQTGLNIAADQEATELAIRLVTRMANATISERASSDAEARPQLTAGRPEAEAPAVEPEVLPPDADTDDEA